MTFDFDRFCAPAESFEHSGEAEALAGLAGCANVLLVSSGRCSVFRGEEVVMAPAGSVLLFSGPLRLVPVGGCHLAGVSLTGEAAADIARALDGPLVLEGAACPGAAEMIDALRAGSLPAAEASAQGYALLCRLALADTEATPLPPLVSAAIAAIREHYAEVYGVEELAKQLNVSKSHLVRSFTASTGTSPGRYLTNVRIEAAKRLLLQKEYSLEVVATLCGFSGANYLCKVFKKSTGHSPLAWRKMALPHTVPKEEERHELEDMLFL